MLAAGDTSQSSRIFSTAPVKLGSCQPDRGVTVPCQPNAEDPVFGFRAAGAALLSNVSYESGNPARWDLEAMKLL